MAKIKDIYAQIGAMLTKKEDKPFSYEELATMLKTSPDALKTFEDAYKRQMLDSGALSENFLQWDTATVKAMLDKRVPLTRDLETLIDRIVGELTDGTRLYIYNEKRGGYYVNYAASRYTVTVTNNDLKKYPEELRPQLTGNLVNMVCVGKPSQRRKYTGASKEAERNKRWKTTLKSTVPTTSCISLIILAATTKPLSC